VVENVKRQVLCVIPARGGSKGIHRKNLQILDGQPMLAHSIIAARAATSVDRVVVSTDDLEIAQLSRSLGAEVVIRPEELSGNTASSESALLHALDHLRTTDGYEPQLLAFVQCTSPLTLAEDIDGTIAQLVNHNADSALAVKRFHYFLWRDGCDGSMQGINHDKNRRLLRQQQEPQFLETGAVYAMVAAKFRDTGHRFFGKTVMYEMPPERCFEIDDPFDLEIARSLFRQRKRQQIRPLPERVSAIFLDFDGVLTDNRVWVNGDGSELVAANRSDGLGLAQLRKVGIDVVVVSTETNPVVAARCRKLGLDFSQGLTDKGARLSEWMAQKALDPREVIYVGNDVNDLGCFAAAGFRVAVADAHPAVLDNADLVLSRAGGHGAVRELCDLLLARLGKAEGQDGSHN
jgi:N-acylneuraminate cytidylyltransferase